MGYILTNGSSTIVTYPYSVELLRSNNPNVSFPASPTGEQLAAWNVFPVTDTTYPTVNVITQTVTEGLPTYTPSGMDDGKYTWVQTWVTTTANAAVQAERTASYQTSAQAQANALITASDTYVAQALESGLNLSNTFIAYRDALANVAALSGYPISPVFPDFPNTVFDTANTSGKVLTSNGSASYWANASGGGTASLPSWTLLFTSNNPSTSNLTAGFSNGITWDTLKTIYKDLISYSSNPIGGGISSVSTTPPFPMQLISNGVYIGTQPQIIINNTASNTFYYQGVGSTITLYAR